MKKKSLRDISRFSTKAACHYRLIWVALVFIVVVILAVGSALILAFDESAPPPTYTFEFTQSKATPAFNPFGGPGPRKSMRMAAWPDELQSSTIKATLKKDYLVSAILREGVDGFTIKLVHLIQSADSRDEATGIFTRLALEQYPGHAVARTLIAEISLPPGSCAKDKQAAPEAAAAAFYAVSAVMRKEADGGDIMLLNGWMPGNNADDALKRALQEAAVKYPTYAAIRTLVTELKVARPACSAPGPMRGHWREA